MFGCLFDEIKRYIKLTYSFYINKKTGLKWSEWDNERCLWEGDVLYDNENRWNQTEGKPELDFIELWGYEVWQMENEKGQLANPGLHEKWPLNAVNVLQK